MSPIKVDAQMLPLAETWAASERRFRLSIHHVGAVAAILDALLVVAVSLVVSVGYHTLVLGTGFRALEAVASGVAVAAFLVPALNSRHAYSLDRLLAPRIEAWPIFISWVIGLLLFLGVAFVFKVSDVFSRAALLTMALVGPVALLGQRRVMRMWLRSLLAAGQIQRPRVVVVTDQTAEEFHAATRQGIVGRGYQVAQVFYVPDQGEHAAFTKVGEDVLQFVRGAPIDEILIAAEWRGWDGIKILASLFRAAPLPVRLMPDATAADIFSFSQVGIRRAYAVELQREPLTGRERMLKRGLDIAVCSALLFCLAPLLVLVALAVKVDSPGPAIFRQTRRGFNGRPFKIFKFRSMRVMEDGPTVIQAQARDARVTRVGRFLRKSSVDELPQLLNVLRGEMSLVGPRPHAMAHDDQYTQLIENYAFRHHSKPGITGWAQVNGFRGETPTVEKMEQRVEHDLWYIANWSVWLDLFILARTGLELLRTRNVY